MEETCLLEISMKHLPLRFLWNISSNIWVLRILKMLVLLAKSGRTSHLHFIIWKSYDVWNTNFVLRNLIIFKLPCCFVFSDEKALKNSIFISGGLEEGKTLQLGNIINYIFKSQIFQFQLFRWLWNVKNNNHFRRIQMQVATLARYQHGSLHGHQ